MRKNIQTCGQEYFLRPVYVAITADGDKENGEMVKIRWELEEAIVLFDLYLQNGSNPNISDEKLMKASYLYNKRAKKLGLLVDSKFRNLSGLKMQLGCVHYVVTKGKEGMSNASQVFHKAWTLHKAEPKRFHQILDEFYQDYDT